MLFAGQIGLYTRPVPWKPGERDPAMWEHALYRIGQPLVKLAAQLSLNPAVVRDSPLPAGPKILAANHPSTTDPFVMTTLVSEPVHILITEAIFKIPAVGRFLRWAGQIPVVVDNERAAFDEALQRLKDGQTVGAPVTLDGDVEDRAYVRTASAGLLRRIGELAGHSERRIEAKAEARRMKEAAWRQFELALQM